MRVDKVLLWIAIVMAIVAFGGRAARAQDEYGFQHYHFSFERVPYWKGLPLARIIQVEPMNEARQAADDKWVSFCRPTIAVDEYGVGRYQYAKPGCEFGRSE